MDRTDNQVITANSWKRLPFTDGTPVPYRDSFTLQEYDSLCRGYLPRVMEDKWFVYFESPYLFLHRSWTGEPVYRVRLSKSEQTVSVTEALWASEVSKSKADEAAYQARLLDFLVSNLLLKKSKPFPTRPEFSDAPPGLYQHSFSGSGYPEQTTTPDETTQKSCDRKDGT